MQDPVLEKIKEINRTNYILWFIVLSGMLILFVIALLLHFFSESNVLRSNFKSDNFVLLFIALFAFAIFYFKKKYLNIRTILDKAKSANYSFSESHLDDLKNLLKNGNVLANAIVILKRNFMIVWFLADLILIIAFIGFLLNGYLQSFIIYSIVAFYSILLNFPSKTYIEKFYYKLIEV